MLLVTVSEEQEVPEELLTGFIGVIAVGLVVVVVRWRSGLMLDGSRLQLRSLLHMRRTATGSSLGLLSSWWRQKLFRFNCLHGFKTLHTHQRTAHKTPHISCKMKHCIQKNLKHLQTPLPEPILDFGGPYAKLCGPDGGGFEWLRT